MNIRVSFHCNSRNECIDLLEFLGGKARLKSPLITLEMKGLSVSAIIYGSATDAEITKRFLLNIYKEWKSINGWMKHGRYVSVKQLMKFIGKPFPVESLVEILKLRGIKVSKEEDEILLEEGVSWELIANLANDLSVLLSELLKVKPKASHGAKSLIISYAYLKGLHAKEALEELGKVKCLKVDGYRVTPTKEWRSLLRTLIGRKRGVSFGDRG